MATTRCAAAKAGILIRDIETLETAGRIEAIAFDKTGTLTLGKPRVSALHPADTAGTGIAVAELLMLAASLEASSEHPLAEALVDKAKAANLALRPASGVAAGLSGARWKVVALPSASPIAQCWP